MLSTMLMARTWRRISRQTTTVNSNVSATLFSATLYTKLVGSSVRMNIICSDSTVRMTNWCSGAPMARPSTAPMTLSSSISRKM